MVSASRPGAVAVAVPPFRGSRSRELTTSPFEPRAERWLVGAASRARCGATTAGVRRSERQPRPHQLRERAEPPTFPASRPGAVAVAVPPCAAAAGSRCRSSGNPVATRPPNQTRTPRAPRAALVPLPSPSPCAATRANRSAVRTRERTPSRRRGDTASGRSGRCRSSANPITTRPQNHASTPRAPRAALVPFAVRRRRAPRRRQAARPFEPGNGPRLVVAATRPRGGAASRASCPASSWLEEA
jgi:hypothetical protein